MQSIPVRCDAKGLNPEKLKCCNSRLSIILHASKSPVRDGESRNI